MADTPISRLAEADALGGEELVVISQLSTVVKIEAATISAQASDQSFNDSGNGFLTAGFAVDDYVYVTGFTGDDANNLYSGQITALTAGKMTIGGAEGAVIMDDAAGETVVIAKWTSRRAAYGGGGGGGGEGVTYKNAHWSIIPNYNAATANGFGTGVTTTNLSARAYASTNSFTKRKRVALTTSSTSAFAQLRTDSGDLIAVGVGFRFNTTIGIITPVANYRLLVGQSGGWTGSQDPSAASSGDPWMIAKDSTDTNLQLMRGDGAGAILKTDLGADFAANVAGQYYEITLSGVEGGTSLEYVVENLLTGAIASGSFDTELPTAITPKSLGVWTQNNGTGGSVVECFGIDYSREYPA